METQNQSLNPRSKKVIVVDWGTTSLRTMLVDESGQVIAEKESQGGIQFIQNKDFETELMNVIGEWLDQDGPIPVIALGMITSKNGWVEVPYVPCPASTRDLARGMMQKKLSNGSDLYFLAGLTDRKRRPFPDVMRGEETQIAGFGLNAPITIVLPGTHSKWARVSDGQVDEFQTFVTGEIFALLSQHSFIAKAATPLAEGEDWDALARGAQVARSCENKDTAFLTQLFSVRTGMLASALTSSEMLSYLSGLVIGNEFRQAMDAGWFKPGDTIGIVGNDGLNDRYLRVAQVFDLDVTDGGEMAAVVGALEIFAARHLEAAE